MEVVVARVRVSVRAADPLSQTGLTSYLEAIGGIEVLPKERCAEADVIVVSADRLTAELTSGLRRAATVVGVPVVLVVRDITEDELLTAVECRVVAVLPRAAASGERIVQSVLTAATGDGVPACDLVEQVERLRHEVVLPDGSIGTGLTSREVDVLRLLADGLDTAEIADELCYSERSVKNVVHAVTSRLNLRNRPHAVAYAMRAGMI